MRRVPSKQCNSKIHRHRDVRALSRLAVLLFCGLVSGQRFRVCAQQHFAAVEYGYKSEGLRRERERLLEEKQQLMLKKEQAFAPARLASEGARTGPEAHSGQPARNSEGPAAGAKCHSRRLLLNSFRFVSALTKRSQLAVSDLSSQAVLELRSQT